MSSPITRYVEQPFGTFADLVKLQRQARPDWTALICGEESASYAQLDDVADRIASGLQRDGVGLGSVVAVCAESSIDYVAAFVGALRTGAAVAPLPPSATPDQLAGMLGDSGASHLFLDAVGRNAVGEAIDQGGARRITFDDLYGTETFRDWLPMPGARPIPVTIGPEQPFNIIYSSGTTGSPKGIVQPHAMRWPQLHLADPPGYGPDSVALLSTPLYSNTTLVSLLPALAGGGTVVLMPRFDARDFLGLSQQYGVTHAMLVPVQYRRILDVPAFDTFDLSRYRLKYATSAPFAAELKAEVLARWPGGLVEYFGMTEGGGSCMLVAHEHPDKLHTVGPPIPGHRMLVVDEHGRRLPPGETGEIVGRSAAMMTGYHNRQDETARAFWYDENGDRFIRSGDIGRMDMDGFLTVIGRKKDVIISGGMNIYPVDLEAALLMHHAVREAAVVGVASRRWGESPVGFVVLHGGASVDADVLKDWTNLRLGKTQRLADLEIVSELPRNALGKVWKAEIRRLYASSRSAVDEIELGDRVRQPSLSRSAASRPDPGERDSGM